MVKQWLFEISKRDNELGGGCGGSDNGSGGYKESDGRGYVGTNDVL